MTIKATLTGQLTIDKTNRPAFCTGASLQRSKSKRPVSEESVSKTTCYKYYQMLRKGEPIYKRN